jgi:hypothetical protein
VKPPGRPAVSGEPLTANEAIEHAARILAEAELERSNLPLMERLEKLAETWLGIAQTLVEKERI